MYRLVPVHYDPLGLLQPCAEPERDLWAIYYGHGWVADFSPHAKALANDVCAYLNNRQKIGAILDIVEPVRSGSLDIPDHDWRAGHEPEQSS